MAQAGCCMRQPGGEGRGRRRPGGSYADAVGANVMQLAPASAGAAAAPAHGGRVAIAGESPGRKSNRTWSRSNSAWHRCTSTR